jgi:hypothetical protein
MVPLNYPVSSLFIDGLPLAQAPTHPDNPRIPEGGSGFGW